MFSRLVTQVLGGQRTQPVPATMPADVVEPHWAAARASIEKGDLSGALSAMLPVIAKPHLEPGQQRLLAAALEALAISCNTSDAARIDAAYLLGCVFLEREEFEAAEWCARIVATDPVGKLHYQVLEIGDDLPAACRAAGHSVNLSTTLFSVSPYGPSVPAYMCTLPGGRVLGHSDIPVSGSGLAYPNRHIHNIATTLNRAQSRRGEMICLASATHLLVCEAAVDDYPGSHVLIGNHFNPGHWMMNHFGRLRVLEEFPPPHDAKLLVPDNIGPVALRSLELAGYPAARLTLIPPGRTARVEQLLVPSMLFGGINGMLYWSDEIAHLIRRTLAPPRARRGKRRFLVSRKGARWRRLQNEDALLAALSGLGFESVDLGQLSLDQQIALAADAEAITGAFGAGMSIVLLAHPGTAVVEIKANLNGVMDVHPLAAAAHGVTYFNALAAAVSTPETPASSLDADMVCNPAAVRAVIVEALQAAAQSAG